MKDVDDFVLGSTRLEHVDVRSVARADRNPKLHNDRAIDASIGRFGFTEPIVIDERTKKLVAGHGRLGSLLRLIERGEAPPAGIQVRDDGAWLVPTLRGWRSKNDDEAEAYILASNQTTISGGWDNSALGRMLLELAEKDPANIVGLGFDEKMLSSLLDNTMPDMGDEDVEALPPVPKEVYVKKGDLWRLGEHRILCGDSTDVHSFDRLFDGEKPALVFTDPPYGVEYNARGISAESRKAVETGVPWRNRDRLSIENDATPEDAERVVTGALSLAGGVEAAFVCCDWKSLEMARLSMAALALEPKACIVWDKMRGVQNLDRFHKQHELILYAGPYGGEKTVAGDVWQCARDFEPDHPTPKPVELVEKAVKAASKRGALVFDPFSGSGATLMACEVARRKARCIELEPRYVQVTIERWKAFTGRQALRLD